MVLCSWVTSCTVCGKFAHSQDKQSAVWRELQHRDDSMSVRRPASVRSFKTWGFTQNAPGVGGVM